MQSLTLAAYLSAHRGPVRPIRFLLRGSKCSLLRLMLALLTTLRFSPGPEYATALPSCHWSSHTARYDRTGTVIDEFRRTATIKGCIRVEHHRAGILTCRLLDDVKLAKKRNA
jgi:hypothetical protein